MAQVPEIALQIRPRTPDGEDTGFVFLCHNSRDKPIIKQIADALELELGTKFFLDVYAIPSGEAFLPWIERSLASASGAAIFLGANGWGPIHLWEAEKALARYREDPNFRLLPVALPGISPTDMARLGSGKVFQEINWADFTHGVDDRESLEKLASALTGRSLPQDRGPARLTPYQVRRDAERWAKSGGTDTSILYTGAQLAEATRLILDNPDFVVADEVMPFLTAAQESQRRFWRRLALGIAAAATLLFATTTVAVIGYTLAEERRLGSLSRQLAIAAREARGADRRLLTAAQAVVTANTAEARGALLEQLQNWRFLSRMTHLGPTIEAGAVEPSSGDILLGTGDGRLLRQSADSRGPPDIIILPEVGAVTALAAEPGSVWLGRANGQVDVLAGAGSARVVLPAPEPRPRRDQAVRTLARQTGGSLIAAGTGSGQLTVRDTTNDARRLDVDEGEQERVTALAFDQGRRWLVAGTGSGTLIFISTDDLQVKQRYPKLEGGVLTLGFSEAGELLAVGSYGTLVTFGWGDGEFQRTSTHTLPALLTVATVDPTGRRVAVGDGSGAVHLYDALGQPSGFDRLDLHANRVSVLAFGSSEDGLVSASVDGTVAFLDLSGASGPSLAIPAFGPDASLLRWRRDGNLVAAVSLLGRAVVARLDGDQWKTEADLLDGTRTALSETEFHGEQQEVAAGFQSLNAEIPDVALDAAAARVAWTTRRGSLLWRALDGASETTVVRVGDGRERGNLALSADGRLIAAIEPDPLKVSIFDLASRTRAADVVTLPAPARSLAFDGTGARLAVGLEDGRIAVFRADRNWTSVGQSTWVHDAPVAGMSFAAGDKYLVSFGSGGGGADRTVALTAADDLTSVRRLQSRQAGGSVSALASGRASNVLAAADNDGRVLLWSLGDFRFIAELKAGTTAISSLTLDDENKRLFTYASDGSFLRWDLDLRRWVTLACAKANRALRPDEWTELLPDDRYRPACDGAVRASSGPANIDALALMSAVPATVP